jgi:hypothetical protein
MCAESGQVAFRIESPLAVPKTPSAFVHDALERHRQTAFAAAGFARQRWEHGSFPDAACLPHQPKPELRMNRDSDGRSIPLSRSFTAPFCTKILSRLCCLVHLRIWNGTKERKPNTAAA